MIEDYVMTIARDGGKGNRHRDRLDRTTFSTSRMMDFFSVKELTAQTGYAPRDWALYVLKELVDNALDACEEARARDRDHSQGRLDRRLGQWSGHPGRYHHWRSRLHAASLEP